MTRLSRFFFAAILLWPAWAAAQGTTTIRATDPVTGASTNVGDAATTSVRMSPTDIDRATFTFGTSKINLFGCVFDDTPPSLLTTGMKGVARCTASRAVHVHLRDASGNAITTWPVTNAGTFAVQAAQSGTWSFRLQDGNGNIITSAARGSERAMSVQIVDAAGSQITLFGGTSSNFGSAFPTPGTAVGFKDSAGTNMAAGNLDASGNLKVNIAAGAAAGGTSSNFTSAFPTPGTAAGFTDGTNMQGGRVFDADSGGGTQYVVGTNLRKIASGGSVEAGTAGDPLRTDPTGTTSQPILGTKTNNNAAPGATNIGALIGVANAAAPTPTEGNQVGASFDLSSRLRAIVDVNNPTSSGADNSMNGTSKASVMPCTVAATPPTVTDTNQNPCYENTRGAQYVSQFGATVTTTTMQNAAVANGNGTNLVTTGMASAVMTVNCSSCSGGTAVNFEGTQNGTDFSSIVAAPVGIIGGVPVNSTTTAGLTYWRVNVDDLSAIRARISAYSAGTVTVSGTASPAQTAARNVEANIYAAGSAITSATRGSERALTVQIVDGSGAQVTTFGGAGGTSSNFGSATPSAGTATGFSDGTNMQAPRAFDADSGGGTQYVAGVSLRKTASGGSVEAGTSSDPLRTDPTGTTRQPVNMDQINGVALLAGSGNTGTGSPRVTLVTDQPQLTTPLNVEVAPTASSTNAVSACYLVSAASTNATSCKGSAGNFYGIRMVNTTATLYYLRLYNTAGAPTCSSATGFIESIPIPASATGAGIVSISPLAINYATGIGFCFTGGSSSTDNTNAATGIFGAILYK
jgi:hypothetical protein